ncbi:MAG: ABC transporter substrate-binding protein [Comamonadaceae bacterium]|nr:ABC transporter substrate-binding protein [Pseudomonadota bacterium]MDE2415808.1 ABC transporter substrate-binding protein [Comamonadaceae bacterium]
MKSLSTLRLYSTLLALAAIPLSQAKGDQGAIVVGASLPLSGTNAAAGQEGLAVLQSYFDSINRAGGIEGRPLQLIALDDAFNPQKAADNARALVAGKAVAIVNCWGTSNCASMVPIVTQAGLPLVGGLAGGGVMRSTPGRYVFNIRASTVTEIDAMARHMTNIGQRSIAVVYQDDLFGKSGLAAAQQVLRQQNMQPVLELTLAPDGSNAAAVADALNRDPAPNGIILVASPPATVSLITQARKNGIRTQFYNLAAQANSAVVRGLGEHTAGVVFTTLVPNPWRNTVAAVKEYQQLADSGAGQAHYSYLGMEVYLNARTLVDGLRKAGRNVQRESLTAALETLEPRQYGPMTVRFGPKQRDGSSYVSLTMIDRRGHFIE